MKKKTDKKGSNVRKDKDFMQRLPDGFYIEPLRNRVMNILRQKDALLAAALGTNVSKDFENYLMSSLDRNENIILAAGGRTRSGKSYAMLELSLQVASYTEIPFTIKNICWHDSQFMTAVKTAKFKEWYLIDETEESSYGVGSMAEGSFIEDFNRICAKKCINRTNVVGDYSTSTDKAIYKLISLARDLRRRVTRFLLYSIEAGENLPLGFVDIYLDKTTCKKMRKEKGLACIVCPEYKKCTEFIAEYEKYKDTNIDRLSAGGKGSKQSVRNDERELVTLNIARQPEFSTCANKDMRKVFVRNNYYKFTNREFTETEIREVAEYAWWLVTNNMVDALAEKIEKPKDKKKNRKIRKEGREEEGDEPEGEDNLLDDDGDESEERREEAVEGLKERGE